MTNKTKIIIGSAAGAVLFGSAGMYGFSTTYNALTNNSSYSESYAYDHTYTIDELCTRADSERNFERDHRDEVFIISGDVDHKSYKSIYFQSNVERNGYNKYKIECRFDDLNAIKELSDDEAVTVSGKLYDFSIGTLTLKDCTLVSSENVTDSNTNSSDTSQVEKPPQRETAIGKSNKDVETLTPSPTKAMPVDNDKTGNWRSSGFASRDVDFLEYALSYYENRFESDNEVHAVINFIDKTTTRISYTDGKLFVTVLEYIKGEESDAYLMFSGKVIKDYIVYTDNGDIEEITESEDKTTSESTTVTSSSIFSSSTSSSSMKSETESSSESKSSSSAKPSDTYSKPEVTTTYVLNTNTKKFHYRSCSEVKKIKPKNYSTVSSRSAAISRGYSPCKRCNP